MEAHWAMRHHCPWEREYGGSSTQADADTPPCSRLTPLPPVMEAPLLRVRVMGCFSRCFASKSFGQAVDCPLALDVETGAATQ